MKSMAGAITAIWARPTRWAGSPRTTATSHGKAIIWMPRLVNHAAWPPRYQRNWRVTGRPSEPREPAHRAGSQHEHDGRQPADVERGRRDDGQGSARPIVHTGAGERVHTGRHEPDADRRQRPLRGPRPRPVAQDRPMAADEDRDDGG